MATLFSDPSVWLRLPEVFSLNEGSGAISAPVTDHPLGWRGVSSHSMIDAHVNLLDVIYHNIKKANTDELAG